uniref:SH2 domain-containing protein n=1 Tax=Callorhinchus milii TaxID=7868 RepID=A0A4W3K8L8_CALMI
MSVRESLPCFHGCISKTECEGLFKLKGTEGSYLFRESETVPGALCLCILYKKHVFTYRILKNYRGYFMFQTEAGFKDIYFKSLAELIAHYGKPGQGLVTQLRRPLKKAKDKLSKQEDNDYEGMTSLFYRIAGK